MPGAAQVEAAGHAGFDFVVIDTEHGPGDGVELENHLRAADAVGVPALVRTSSAAPGEILAALDTGAAGVVVPHVLDAAAARAVVEAAHYPPTGRRGVATSTRAGRYGAVSLHEQLGAAAERTCVVVQIEDAGAVPLAEEILAVAGVDAVLIGTVDLAVSLGRPGAPPHADVDEAVAAILRAASATGRAALAVASSAEEAAAWRGRGVSGLIAVATMLIHSAFVNAAGALAVERAHAGEVPLVLLPGMLGDEDLWSGVVARLDGRLQLESARIDIDDSVPEMADTVLATAPRAFALAGHSLGAIVALEIARRAPGRVTRLALLNASARAASDVQREAWAAMRTRTEQGAFAAVAAEFARACLTPARRAEPALVERCEAMAARIGPLGFLRQLAAQATRPDSGPSLAAIDVPVLIVTGAEDDVCPPALQEELVTGIPGASHVVLPGVGHLSPLEDPDAVAAALGGWLDA